MTGNSDGLWERVAAHAARRPGATAVVDGGLRIGYAELADAAGRVHGALTAAGVPAGSLVGLRLRRGWQVPAAVLGILRHGCAYVPIDPDYPAARQEFLLRDSGIGTIVEAEETGSEGRRLTVRRVADPGPAPVVPDGTAYVIYTSGSTGTPKGVIVGRRQITALMSAAESCFDFGRDDVWTLFHSHSFDFSVWESWGALWFGGTAVVVPPECTYESGRFAELLAREGVTVLNQVPASFGYLRRQLDAEPVKLPDLRYVIFGGEPLNTGDVRLWHAAGHAPHARLVNMYGITETTVHVTMHVLEDPAETGAGPRPGPAGSTPIGKPLPHLSVLLADEDLRPVADGTPGEIVVRGAGVADGYLGRPELTAERFVVVGPGGAVGYRSGDWAVRDEYGDLHFLGRRDGQVQIRGFRIERGEVETAVAGHPELLACEVTTPTTAGGESLLVAHVLPRRWPGPSVSELRGHAARHLPRHMVPSRFVSHERFPLTAHGKVDRAALDEPGDQA